MSSEPSDWSQLELFSLKPSDSSVSTESPTSCSPGSTPMGKTMRLKPGLIGQTITMTQLGQMYTAEIMKLGRRLDGTPSILLRRVVDVPGEPVNVGGVLLPAEAEWLVGWNECRPFMDTRSCPLLD